MTLGDKLKKARISKNFTQEYLAEVLNVSQKTYSNFENDKSKPDFQQVENIAKAGRGYRYAGKFAVHGVEKGHDPAGDQAQAELPVPKPPTGQDGQHITGGRDVVGTQAQTNTQVGYPACRHRPDAAGDKVRYTLVRTIEQGLFQVLAVALGDSCYPRLIELAQLSL